MTDPAIRAAAIRLYDRFTHVHGDRRAFMADLAKLAGGTVAAEALLTAIAANPAAAAIVEPSDERLSTSQVQWQVAPDKTMKGYLAVPRRMTDPLPAIMVIHENRGLNAHTEDVARRAALAGFVALAPDFLSLDGGTPADEDAARDMIGKLNPVQTVSSAVATVNWLRQNPRVNGRVGAVGFCWGGGLINRLAIAAGPALAAGVAYYGPAGDPAQAGRVKARLLLHYAGNDERVNAGAPAWIDALKAAGVQVTRHDYPGTEHAFHNDTSAERYNEAAARLSWDRTISFFAAALGGPRGPVGAAR